MKRISSQRVVLTSFLVDLSDVLLNAIVAFLSGSVVMLAEALQGAADLLTSGLLLIGLKQAKRRPDKHHHFGYGREIYFWVLMAGISMFVVTALTSFSKGWDRFLHPQPITHLPLMYGALTIGLVMNAYALSLSWQRLYHQHPHRSIARLFIHSDLVETKATFVLDLMGTAASLFGLVSLLSYQATGIMHFDGIGAMIIGAVTGFFSILLMIEVKDLLVGRSADLETEEKIRHAAREVKSVLNVLDLRTMYIGSGKLLVNMEVHVAAAQDTEDIEILIDKIKHRVKQIVPSVRHIQVEIETPENR